MFFATPADTPPQPPMLHCTTGEGIGQPPMSASELSDSELETHIADCGRQMEAAMQRWEQHGCFGDRGEADHWKRLMYAAISSRGAAQVARLEMERGIA